MIKISTATSLLLLFAVPYSTFATIADASSEIELNKPHVLAKFKEWVLEFEKEYEHDDEFAERFMVWAENDAFIKKHNSQIPKPSFTVGHNHFSDLTNEEYQRFNFLGEYSSTPPPLPSIETVTTTTTTRILGDTPKEVNWIKEGALTPVKNQGACGSCWSFSAATAVESAMFLKTGELVALSEQQLLDCDEIDQDCNGGLMDYAFTYIEKAGGLCTNSSYPYEAMKGSCRVKECDIVEGSDVIGFVDVKRSEEALMAAIVVQPVCVGIEADKLSFQLYKSGVYTDDCPANIDHGVVAVGYGTDEETKEDYWLIRNSWGAKWGDKGNIMISRKNNNEKRQGNCGIYSVPSRPVVD